MSYTTQPTDVIRWTGERNRPAGVYGPCPCGCGGTDWFISGSDEFGNGISIALGAERDLAESMARILGLPLFVEEH